MFLFSARVSDWVENRLAILITIATLVTMITAVTIFTLVSLITMFTVGTIRYFFPVPVCAITVLGVPGGTLVSMNYFSTLCR
jgi:hypothetical protein